MFPYTADQIKPSLRSAQGIHRRTQDFERGVLPKCWSRGQSLLRLDPGGGSCDEQGSHRMEGGQRYEPEGLHAIIDTVTALLEAKV